MALAPFQWVGNQAVSTPEAARRQRALAESLISRSSTPASNWGEGLNHIASALTGSVLQGRTDEAEAAARDEVAALLAGLSPESGFSDITAALANPWVADSPGAASIASALLGENMRRSDPMYQMQLERGGLELDALRNPAPPAPVFEGGQWWDTSTGMPNALTPRAQDDTGSIQNYEYLLAQGIDPAVAQEMAFGGGGTTINNMGNIPAGYELITDPETGAARMQPIPGSPAAVEAAQAEEQAAMRGEQSGRYADVVLDDLDRALGLVGGNTTGILGTLLQQVPGSNSRNLDALLQTIRSNIGFDRLQAMRAASPTGGALGAVSDFENRQLQSTLGNLEQSQSEEQLRRNLERVKETYLDIIHGPGNRPNGAGGAGTAIDYNAPEPPPGWSGEARLWQYMSPEDRALWQ